jgi:hypothetical protein
MRVARMLSVSSGLARRSLVQGTCGTMRALEAMDRSLVIAIAVVSTLIIGSWVTYFTFGEPIPDVADRNVPGATTGPGKKSLHPG